MLVHDLCFQKPLYPTLKQGHCFARQGSESWLSLAIDMGIAFYPSHHERKDEAPPANWSRLPCSLPWSPVSVQAALRTRTQIQNWVRPRASNTPEQGELYHMHSKHFASCCTIYWSNHTACSPDTKPLTWTPARSFFLWECTILEQFFQHIPRKQVFSEHCTAAFTISCQLLFFPNHRGWEGSHVSLVCLCWWAQCLRGILMENRALSHFMSPLLLKTELQDGLAWKTVYFQP